MPWTAINQGRFHRGIVSHCHIHRERTRRPLRIKGQRDLALVARRKRSRTLRHRKIGLLVTTQRDPTNHQFVGSSRVLDRDGNGPTVRGEIQIVVSPSLRSLDRLTNSRLHCS